MCLEMTQKEKIKQHKDIIIKLYSEQVKSQKYIANLLGVGVRMLGIAVREWGLETPENRHLKPSDRKFFRKNKQLIKARLDKGFTAYDIAKELNTTEKYLKFIIEKDVSLSKAFTDNKNREYVKLTDEAVKDFKPIKKEEWVSVNGYSNYEVSNLGRVKSFQKEKPIILKQTINKKNNRPYVSMVNDKKKRRTLQVSRLVASHFVEGKNEHRNTINHIDGNIRNNKANNLQWVSQSYNNAHAYRELKQKPSIAYRKLGNFKKIIINDKYEFKTVKAFAKFIGVSDTQARRYLTNEVANNPYKIEIIY